MAQFLEFLAQQWMLVGALLTAIALLLFHESRKAGASLSPQQLSVLINREDAVVVDLRDAAEFRQGHVVDAINMPHAKLMERLDELEKYRERPLVLVCKLGQHAGGIAKQLRAKGFARVYRLGGGMAEWHHMQLPLVKG
ncbi:MAG TPA: rhodanese-like domain-containing protein [Spongiibacteraceae bacterium]|jgi:rhodanese-related sulfurtransferase|nr:rhodanese-like domain-containing protein [Spongiibacteraceae bacterium]HUH36549.1 rhodanese-like domain-containing protein [Spongiibacteraceae bacterium]